MLRVSNHSEIGQRIAALRKRRGYSQATVSRRAGFDASYLSRLERGRIHPTVRTAMRIATALRVGIDELLGPLPPQHKGMPCPISQSGHCLMDLIASDAAGTPPGVAAGAATAKPTVAKERYTTHQLRILRRFAGLVRRNESELLHAFETLLTRIEATTKELSDDPARRRSRRHN